MTKDPTYDSAAIAANQVWALAFRLSEFENDTAPLGWSHYIPLADWLIRNFDMMPRCDGTGQTVTRRTTEELR